MLELKPDTINKGKQLQWG